MKCEGKEALYSIVLLFNDKVVEIIMTYINFNEKHQQMIKNELHYDR